ncbi:xanthine dehydrogenase family protein molybdopterin-binding subunit [Pseudomaricurvus alkylphenolicus]|uniref:xanthine dehydrogenase family protein molybdopterin-binding subunit n=1 Tax=Pseudomaricurvus alkylphenolicus TaxID=1306991 RepID=UPI001421E298|nr:molybdopterin cofactor-binding domain-containing protein [Pseudomaricurvus alkylphenolicus]NIB43395.1 xanthine dehydrogenase family protein molybdopterin-binding subunit [Pseudomaricurvus alkylphenolicus]
MKAEVKISRRVFLARSALACSGLAIGVAIPTAANATETGNIRSDEVNAWVVVRSDDTVLIRIARSEMGQGTLTGLAQLVAEELECDWSKIVTEFPTPGESAKRGRPWGAFGTFGSHGIRDSHEYVRKGGAIARELLVLAAAKRLRVHRGDCRANNGVIIHAPSGRRFRYGEVAEEAARLAQDIQPKEFNFDSLVLKSPADWKIIGKPLKRLDTGDKVNGKQVYGADVRLPDMLNASVRRCPVFGGRLKSYRSANVLQQRGIEKVVTIGDDAIAVVADTWWRANKALDNLDIQWDEGPNATQTSDAVDAMLREGLSSEDAVVGNRNGDPERMFDNTEQMLEAVYAYPHQTQAPMEPMNATVFYDGHRCEAWVPTQDGEKAFQEVVRASELPPAQCEVHKLIIGGGFGRRGHYDDDFLSQAVQIARQVPGRPVKLLWSREEDMTHSRYHPVMHCKLQAAISNQGQLQGLRMRLCGQSILAGARPQLYARFNHKDPFVFQGLNRGGDASIGYGIPSLLIDYVMRNSHVPPGFWRGVNINQNALFLECFMDELAEAAGKDPYRFRREHMHEHPNHRAVLDAVADRIGWDQSAPEDRYRGLAQAHAYGSYVAAACELSVSEGNRVKIHRIVAATDCGYAVNPAQIRRQVSGSFVFGLSALFMQACTVKGGRIEQHNFDTYPSMRMAQTPEVETIIMESRADTWGGVGEPTIAVAAPAVLNALYRATGKRYRDFPLSKHGLLLV